MYCPSVNQTTKRSVPKYRIVTYGELYDQQLFRHEGRWLYKSGPNMAYANFNEAGQMFLVWQDTKVGIWENDRTR